MLLGIFLRNFLFLLFLSSFIFGKANAFCWGIYKNIESSVTVLNASTNSSLNTNSYSSPRIEFNFSGCIWFSNVSSNFTLGSGESTTQNEYGFKAIVTIMPKDNIDMTSYCSSKATALEQSVCNFYKKIFAKGITPPGSSDTKTDYFLALCGYRTTSPKWWEDFVNYTGSIFTDVAGGILSILGGPGVAQVWHWDDVPTQIDGYELVGCSPIVVAPFPPPYGVPKHSIYEATPTTQPICKDASTPVYSLGDSQNSICMAPQDGVTYSSFKKTCMRVSFNNPMRTNTGSSTDYTISISENVTPSPASTIVTNGTQGVGVSVEALYTWPSSGISSCISGTNCVFTTQDYSKLITKANIYNNGTTSTPVFVGYNLAAFQDLCYDFTNNTADQVTITDIYGTQRTFTVAPSCNINNNCNNILYTEQQICLQDVNTKQYFGCTNRPSMTPLSVNFCNGVQNTDSKACMNVTIPDTGVSCQISYDKKSGLMTNNCTDTPLSAILTDRCYNYAFSGSTPETFFAPYVQSSTNNAKASCSCPSDQSCPPGKIGLCYNGGSYKSGASKFCLKKFSPPMAARKSLAQCTDNCNSICTSMSTTPGLCTRLYPETSVTDTLPADQYCLIQKVCTGANCQAIQKNCKGTNCTQTASNCNGTNCSQIMTNIATRSRLPIEDDLCTDVLLFDPVDCTTITNPTYQAQCQQFQQKCQQQQDNKYINLDECNTSYNKCLANNNSSSDCYFIAKNSRYTPPSVPVYKCPPGWTGQQACGANYTFNNMYFYSKGQSVPPQVSASQANSVGCNLHDGGYRIHCCDGTFWGDVNNICPTPQ